MVCIYYVYGIMVYVLCQLSPRQPLKKKIKMKIQYLPKISDFQIYIIKCIHPELEMTRKNSCQEIFLLER